MLLALPKILCRENVSAENSQLQSPLRILRATTLHDLATEQLHDSLHLIVRHDMKQRHHAVEEPLKFYMKLQCGIIVEPLYSGHHDCRNKPRPM